ncbi:MAG TPA: 2-amino-4-hydroxy-6-hydroxymethyldihydropteridine diphosphokinase, partial [Pseudomonadales bacterium]|nr:2-amino-4-hydroxy-6-hydroxymethyldihydropteridine diphosphokinase [Pseudomonadales bacterium]
QTKAIGPGEQPDYINAVAELLTELSPIALLDELQQIENDHGRERGEIRWTARTLDLDLLLYNRQQIGTARLNVPHPLLSERNFVLYPLHEIAPDLTLPNGTSVAALLARVSPEGIHRLDVPV